MGVNMGLKVSSMPLNIGGGVLESAANTFTQAEITLPLNTLDREVMVITDILWDVEAPDLTAGADSATNYQISKTSQTAISGIQDPDIVGVHRLNIVGGVVGFETSAPGNEFSTGDPKKDYIAILATPNFFVAVEGQNNVTTQSAGVRLRCFRAVADASTYAALVTEELNA
tara:strand:- start:711 stop:1223 length:513 start_codon:yes stop_codon:yes gene_type:complete